MAEPVDPMLAYHLNFGGGPAPQPLDFDTARQQLLQRTTGPAVQNMHYHDNPLAAPQPYINADAIEPIAFGSLGDPVSQLAFLGAPALLRGTKAVLDAAAQPGPSMRGVFASERGNLGTPPVGPRGEPLPQSVLRNEAGELERYYHGTGRQYPDFEQAKFGSGEGSNLYGPGIYTSNTPKVAGGVGEPGDFGYAGTAGWMSEEKAGYFAEQQRGIAQRIAQWQRRKDVAQRTGDTATEDYAEKMIGSNQVELQELLRQKGLVGAPNVRPVYPNVTQPFDIDADIPLEVAHRLLAAAGMDPTLSQAMVSGEATGGDVYRALTSFLSDKNAVNRVLADAGYDGITHVAMGGSGVPGVPRRVAIAFSPDQVYPSFGIDALRQHQASPLAGYGPQASPLGGTP